MINWFKRVYNKFKNAINGLYIMIREERSLWVHFATAFIVIIFGFVFELNTTEWALIIFAIGLVIAMEIINTAIEYLVDIVVFEYNVKVKKVKDVAAMATLFSVLTAITIGALVFIPAIIDTI